MRTNIAATFIKLQAEDWTPFVCVVLMVDCCSTIFMLVLILFVKIVHKYLWVLFVDIPQILFEFRYYISLEILYIYIYSYQTDIVGQRSQMYHLRII